VGPKKSDRLSTQEEQPCFGEEGSSSKPSARAAPKPAASARPPRGSPRRAPKQGGQGQDQAAPPRPRRSRGRSLAKVERVESEPKERPKDHAREAKEPKEKPPQGRRMPPLRRPMVRASSSEQGRERSRTGRKGCRARGEARGKVRAFGGQKRAGKGGREKTDRDKGTRATRAKGARCRPTDHAGEEQGVFDLRRVHEALRRMGIGADQMDDVLALWMSQEIEVVDDVAQLKLSPLRADDERNGGEQQAVRSQRRRRAEPDRTTSVPPKGADRDGAVQDRGTNRRFPFSIAWRSRPRLGG